MRNVNFPRSATFYTHWDTGRIFHFIKFRIIKKSILYLVRKMDMNYEQNTQKNYCFNDKKGLINYKTELWRKLSFCKHVTDKCTCFSVYRAFTFITSFHCHRNRKQLMIFISKLRKLGLGSSMDSTKVIQMTHGKTKTPILFCSQSKRGKLLYLWSIFSTRMSHSF